MPAAAAGAADLPSAEASVLLTLKGTTGAPEEAVLLPNLQRAVAVEIRDAAEVARGDLLLALATSLRP